MKFVDALNVAPPPPPPRVPAMPFTIVEMPYGPPGMERVHSTVVRNGLVGEVVDENHELYRAHEYVEFLLQEIARLKLEAETAVLSAPTVPANWSPEPAAAPSEPINPPEPPPANTSPTPAIPAVPRDGEVYTGVDGNLRFTVGSDFPDDEPPTVPTEGKRVLVARELLADPSASNGVIAARAGCSDELARRVRKELEAAGQLQPVTAVVTKGGATYPVGHVASIANSADSPAETAVGDATATVGGQLE